MATVRRKDITLEETYETEYSYAVPDFETTSVWWTARLNGRSSSGEAIEVSRSSLHAGEALQLLEEALEKEGWTVR